MSFNWTLRPVTIDTVPKLFAPASVMSLPAPAVKLAVPGTTRAPDCVMPAAVTVRLPEIDSAPRSSAVVSSTETSASVPGLAKVTVPPKLLAALVSAIEVVSAAV